MLATLFVLTAAVSSTVEPIWSVSEGEQIPFDASYGPVAHTVLPDGSGFLIAGELSRDGYAATIRLAGDGQVQKGQIGHVTDAQLRPEAIFASQDGQVLARLAEPKHSRGYLVLLEADGTVRWRRSVNFREARFFADGDVLVSSGNQLQRLAGSDGGVRWVRNLLELDALATKSAFSLAKATGPDLQLAVQHQTPFTPSAFDAPRFISLSAETGQLQWQRDRSPAAADTQVFQSCPQIGLGEDTVYVWTELTASHTDLVLERRAGTDGGLLWSTRIPEVHYDDGPCDITVTSTQIVISSHDESAGTTLAGLSHTGMALWRHELSATGPSRLLPLPGGDFVLSSLISSIDPDEGTRLERRDHKGSPLWSVTLDGFDVQGRVVDGTVHLSWSTTGSDTTLHLEHRALSSGAQLSAQQVRAVGARISPTDIEFLDGIPFGVSAARPPDSRGIRFRRLDPLTGGSIWSRDFLLDESASEIRSVSILGGAPDRVPLFVTHQHPDGRDRMTLMAVERTGGKLLWQRTFDRPPNNLEQVRLVADGSVYLHLGTSLSLTLVRLSAATGLPLWTQPRQGSPQVPRGNDLLALVYPASGGPLLTSIHADSGLDRWSSPLPTSFYLQMVEASVPERVVTLLETSESFSRRSVLQQLAGSTGMTMWSLPLNSPQEDVSGGTVSQFAPDQLLVSTRLQDLMPSRVRPQIDRIDPTTGGLLWSSRPQLSGDRWRTVRILPGSTANHAWARSLRYVRHLNLGEERLALTTVALADGAVGNEHLLARDYESPIGSFGTQNFVAGVTPDGIQIRNHTPDGTGLGLPRMQRLPAVGGGNQGDIRLHRVGKPGTEVTALGPDTIVELEVTSQSQSNIDTMVLGFESPDDQLTVRFLDCVVTSGNGNCDLLPANREIGIALSAQGTLRLRFELYDPSFQHRRQFPSRTNRGFFYLDTPYAYGDQDLGNNIAEIQVVTGGFSNSFE